MKDKQLCDSSATLPPKNRDRHFFERQYDGSIKPVTFRLITRLDAYEYDGRIYKPELISAMIRAGILYPATSRSARVYPIKRAAAA